MTIPLTPSGCENCFFQENKENFLQLKEMFPPVLHAFRWYQTKGVARS